MLPDLCDCFNQDQECQQQPRAGSQRCRAAHGQATSNFIFRTSLVGGYCSPSFSIPFKPCKSPAGVFLTWASKSWVETVGTQLWAVPKMPVCPSVHRPTAHRSRKQDTQKSLCSLNVLPLLSCWCHHVSGLRQPSEQCWGSVEGGDCREPVKCPRMAMALSDSSLGVGQGNNILVCSTAMLQNK